MLMAAACAICMAACASDAAQSSASASENTAADASSGVPQNFMSWTKADWDKASSDEKYEAAADLIRTVQNPEMSLEDFVNQAKDDPGLDAEVIEVEGLIEAAFSSQDGITLGEAGVDVSPMEQDQQ